MTSRQIAGAPITWGVCEVPGWGLQMTPGRVLSEMATLGITGCKGPERVPRQVIPGVDKPAEDPSAKSLPSR